MKDKMSIIKNKRLLLRGQDKQTLKTKIEKLILLWVKAEKRSYYFGDYSSICVECDLRNYSLSENSIKKCAEYHSKIWRIKK